MRRGVDVGELRAFMLLRASGASVSDAHTIIGRADFERAERNS
jgi:hypothetical protein